MSVSGEISLKQPPFQGEWIRAAQSCVEKVHLIMGLQIQFICPPSLFMMKLSLISILGTILCGYIIAVTTPHEALIRSEFFNQVSKTTNFTRHPYLLVVFDDLYHLQNLILNWSSGFHEVFHFSFLNSCFIRSMKDSLDPEAEKFIFKLTMGFDMRLSSQRSGYFQFVSNGQCRDVSGATNWLYSLVNVHDQHDESARYLLAILLAFLIPPNKALSILNMITPIHWKTHPQNIHPTIVLLRDRISVVNRSSVLRLLFQSVVCPISTDSEMEMIFFAPRSEIRRFWNYMLPFVNKELIHTAWTTMSSLRCCKIFTPDFNIKLTTKRKDIIDHLSYFEPDLVSREKRANLIIIEILIRSLNLHVVDFIFLAESMFSPMTASSKFSIFSKMHRKSSALSALPSLQPNSIIRSFILQLLGELRAQLIADTSLFYTVLGLMNINDIKHFLNHQYPNFESVFCLGLRSFGIYFSSRLVSKFARKNGGNLDHLQFQWKLWVARLVVYGCQHHFWPNECILL